MLLELWLTAMVRLFLLLNGIIFFRVKFVFVVELDKEVFYHLLFQYLYGLYYFLFKNL